MHITTSAKVKNQGACFFLIFPRRRTIDGPSEKGGTKRRKLVKQTFPYFVAVFRSLKDPRRSITPEANSDGGDFVGTRYAPLGNWKPLLENETSLPTSWSAAIIHVRLFLHCVRVWLQIFRATSLKVFLALSLSFTFVFFSFSQAFTFFSFPTSRTKWTRSYISRRLAHKSKYGDRDAFIPHCVYEYVIIPKRPPSSRILR